MKPEARHHWKSKSYKTGPVSTDLFEDGPVYRAKLEECSERLIELIRRDPARPRRSVAA